MPVFAALWGICRRHRAGWIQLAAALAAAGAALPAARRRRWFRPTDMTGEGPARRDGEIDLPSEPLAIWCPGIGATCEIRALAASPILVPADGAGTHEILPATAGAG
jgi:hypothetical protein